MNPAMLLVDVTDPLKVVQIIISSLIGLFGVAASLNGFLYQRIPMLLRFAMAAGGLGMMVPGSLSDVIGLVVVGGVVLYQRMSSKRAQNLEQV